MLSTKSELVALRILGMPQYLGWLASINPESVSLVGAISHLAILLRADARRLTECIGYVYGSYSR